MDLHNIQTKKQVFFTCFFVFPQMVSSIPESIRFFWYYRHRTKQDGGENLISEYSISWSHWYPKIEVVFGIIITRRIKKDMRLNFLMTQNLVAPIPENLEFVWYYIYTINVEVIDVDDCSLKIEYIKKVPPLVCPFISNYMKVRNKMKSIKKQSRADKFG